jgi:hypothetical protein
MLYTQCFILYVFTLETRTQTTLKSLHFHGIYLHYKIIAVFWILSIASGTTEIHQRQWTLDNVHHNIIIILLT